MNPLRSLLLFVRLNVSRLTDALARRMKNSFYLYLAAFFSLLVLLDASVFHFASNMRQKAFDTMVQHRLVVPKPDPDIVIVDVNEASLAALAGDYGRWPWPRQVFGEFLEHLEKQHPQAVVFDILFSDPDVYNPDSDAYFNNAVAGTTNTFFPFIRLDPSQDKLSQVKAAMLPGATALDGADQNATVAVVLPYFKAILDSGRIGTHNIYPDSDGIVREYRLFHDDYGWKLPSLPLTVGTTLKYPVGDAQNVLLNWRGRPFTYRYISFSDVFNDMLSQGKKRPADEFKGKVVLIGSTAPSLFDVKATAMAKQFPGVEILATAIDNVKHDDYLHLTKGALSFVAISLLVLWSTSVGFFKNVDLERFDRIFGLSQFGLLGVSYASINFTNTYLDLTGPVAVASAYYSVARIYAFTVDRSSLGGLLDGSGAGGARGAVLLLRLAPSDALNDGILQKVRRAAQRAAGPGASAAALRGNQKGLWGLYADTIAVAWTAAGDPHPRATAIRDAALAALKTRLGEAAQISIALAEGAADPAQPADAQWRALFALAAAQLMKQPE